KDAFVLGALRPNGLMSYLHRHASARRRPRTTLRSSCRKMRRRVEACSRRSTPSRREKPTDRTAPSFEIVGMSVRLCTAVRRQEAISSAYPYWHGTRMSKARVAARLVPPEPAAALFLRAPEIDERRSSAR